MLDKLSQPPAPIVESIRHIRFTSSPLIIKLIDHNCGILYRSDALLKLQYYLRVDMRTILRAYRPWDAYHALTNLVAHGNGWKELRFVAPSSHMLGYNPRMLQESKNPRNTHASRSLAHRKRSYWRETVKAQAYR
jgi:hypothetical protein